MSSRPRRSAATKANEVISVHARWADSPERSERSERSMSSRRSGRASGVSISRDAPSSPGGDPHLSLTVKVPSNKLRQATRGGRGFQGGEIVQGKRNRGGKKSYVVDSSPDEDEEEEEEAEIEVEEEDDDDDMDGDEDAEGEDDMDVDAEGEEDAEGDIDMDLAPPPPTITVSKPSRSKPAPRASASKVVQDDDDDDDDLSDPADSDAGDETMGFADETMADDGDEDAEGEEIEVAGQEGDEEEEEEEEEEEVDSEDEGSQEESPDLTKMTKRQRARFEDEPQQYMKLSDEVQAKKVFTAEELSMRRQEMARRRRNLSEKRNEEVKMETINKLLKKQAPKINRKAAGNGDTPGDDSQRPNPAFIRWVSNKSGVRVAVAEETLDSPAGKIFGPAPKLASGKMVEEVA
ncbi:hypothetical protein FALBO_9649 [Fusarium albosuccineum]|uniref:INO80 complex subunit B-like conserved region domain-containing protein n=1 Tax=Fusarium albosuccineum TaxID=1237068 RepID=A0A8H4L9F0_9HYPO|nr:hypothetical protein FALBO_9649 [Fusarium albosuccineum]